MNFIHYPRQPLPKDPVGPVWVRSVHAQTHAHTCMDTRPVSLCPEDWDILIG